MMICLFIILLNFFKIIVSVRKVVNCPTNETTFLANEEYVQFESLNYPIKANGNNLSCFQKFKTPDDKSNSKIWFVYLNGELKTFDIFGNGPIDKKAVIWDKQPLWFSYLVNWNEMIFSINDYVPEINEWRGFQAFIYATSHIQPTSCPLSGKTFYLNDYGIIPISSSYYFPNNNEDKNAKVCQWQFQVPDGFKIKVVIKQIHLKYTSSLKVLRNGNFIGYLDEPGVRFFNARKIDIVYKTDETLSFNHGFGAIVTMVDSEPKNVNTCNNVTFNNGFEFSNYNIEGYKNNELCEMEIVVDKGQTLQVEYFGYLEDGVDKFIGTAHNTYNKRDLTQNSKWIFDEKENTVLLKFTSDGSLTKAGFQARGKVASCECSFKRRNSWPVNTMVYWDVMANNNAVGYCNNMNCSYELIFSETCSVVLLPKIKLRPNSTDSVKIYQNNKLIDDIKPNIEYNKHYNLGFVTSLQINFESDNLLRGIYPAPYVLFGTMCLNNLASSTIDLSIHDFSYTLDFSTIKAPKFMTINVPEKYTLDMFLIANLYILPSDKRLEQIYLYDSNTTKNFVSTFKGLPRNEKHNEMQYYTASSSSLTLFIHASRAPAIAFFRLREVHAQNCNINDNVIPVANADVTITSISDGPCFLTLLHWSDSCESAQYFNITTDSEVYVKYVSDTNLSNQYLEFNKKTISKWSAIYFYGVVNSFIIPPYSYLSLKSSSFFGGKGQTTKEILVSEEFACPSFETTTIKSITIPLSHDMYSNIFCQLTIKFLDLSEFGTLYIYSKTNRQRVTEENQVFDFMSDSEDRKIFVELNESVKGRRGYVIEYEMLTKDYNGGEITTTKSEISTTLETTQLSALQLTSTPLSSSTTSVTPITLFRDSSITQSTEIELSTTFKTLELTSSASTLIPNSKTTSKQADSSIVDYDQTESTSLPSESSSPTLTSSKNPFESDEHNDLKPEQTTPAYPLGEVTTSKNETNETSIKWWWWITGGCLIAIILFIIIIIIWAKKKRSLIKLGQRKATTTKTKTEIPVAEVKENQRLKTQLDPKDVIIDFNNILGKGANATVYKTLIKGRTKNPTRRHRLPTIIFQNYNAAIKIPTNSHEEEIDLFIRELDNLMSLGSHPNIITFLGWTHYNNVPCIITELASTNLLEYVKSFRGQVLPIKTFYSILLQISQALEHVASMKMIHRDVACRNILLTNRNVAKLADFGLCCHCDDTFTYKASFQKRFPLKWLAIESLVDRLFSEKSDSWSFGILCYEIFSYGAVPYPTLSSDEMLEFLKSGKRLEKPNASTYEIYGLMLGCWRECPQYRPNFKEIGNRLRIILENETAKYGYLKLQNPSTPNEQ